MELPGPLLNPSSKKKLKKSDPKKNSYNLGNGIVLHQKNLIKLFKTFWSPKKKKKNLNKIPSGETGCFSDH